MRILCLVLMAMAARAEVHDTSAGPVEVTQMVGGLDEPWAVAFIPGAMLITERDGRLLHIAGGAATPVAGVPEVWAFGQGGLLDVIAARDFARTREVFLSFSEVREGGLTGTALAAARLSQDGARLEDVRVIFRQRVATAGPRHFGSRIVEAPDGSLFLTIGDRGERPSAQDLERHSGKVLRIARDGSVPADNPLVGRPGLDEIWSWGHRNPQGATLDAQGRLWTAEHGAAGGDEVNQPSAGLNYGWPVISYGRHYSGARIGSGTSQAGMEQPVFYWDPSIAPSGMAAVSGDPFQAWAGDLLVGSLKFDYIARVTPGAGEAEQLFRGDYGRIRDVRIGPDGAIWFLSVGDGALYRAAPAS